MNPSGMHGVHQSYSLREAPPHPARIRQPADVSLRAELPRHFGKQHITRSLQSKFHVDGSNLSTVGMKSDYTAKSPRQ
jgi:hypothetical protein